MNNLVLGNNRFEKDGNKTVILAPHIDDELIGCWSVLNQHRLDLENGQTQYLGVAFFFDLTPDRMARAIECSEYYGFDYRFFPESPQQVENEMANLTTFNRVYVPSRHDWHIHHRLINAWFRQKATHFYSVDMHEGTPLTEREARTKKKALNKFYDDQKKLWKRDEKYFLFESIQLTDYDVYVTIKRKDPFPCTVTCLAIYEDLIKNLDFLEVPERAYDQVLSICRQGKVLMQTSQHIFEV